jgi:membrane associated rhomboid family serine protease
MLFLPLDRRINDRIPWVIIGLAAINSAVTYHVYFGFNEARITAVFDKWGAIPSDLQAHAWLTHMFLHGGPEHLIGNLAFLVLFGMNVERRLGSAATLLLYLLSGFAALALFVAFNRDFDFPLVGASGAISGIVGMYLVLFGKRTVEVMWFAVFVGGIIRVPALVVASTWVGIELIQAVLLNDKVMVAHWAHVGGFAGGFGLTPLLLLIHRGHPEVYASDTKRRVRDNFEEKSYIPAAPASPRADGLRIVAREWRPVTLAVRRIVDGVAPGSGAFSTPARLAAGLSPPQADDLRGRLERAGYPAGVLPQADEIPDAPLVFIERLEIVEGGIALTEARGTRKEIDLRNGVRLQAGVAKGTPILDIVTRDPGVRYRLSAATAAVPVDEVIAELRKIVPGFEMAVNGFHSLADLDDYFRWRLQLAA